MNGTLRRIRLLLKRDIAEVLRPVALSAATVAGIVLLFYLMHGISTHTPTLVIGTAGGHQAVFRQLLYIGGLIVTSRAFREVHDKARNHDWFMLPASTAEKFVARLLLTSVGYASAVLVGYFLATVLAAGIAGVLTGSSPGIFNPLDREALRAVHNYWIMQSIFLFGAAYFRKLHFIKTILSLVVFFIALSWVAAAVFRIVFTGYFDGMMPQASLLELLRNAGKDTPWHESLAATSGIVRVVVGVIYQALLAPFFWIATCVRLHETEVSDAVS